MDLINKQVRHSRFGEGSVVEHSDFQIKIHFVSGNKKFIYPDAFGGYLTLVDPKAADSVKKIIQERDIERKDEEMEHNRVKALQLEEQKNLLQRENLLKNIKLHSSAQAAFWCEEEDQNKVFTEWRVFAGVTKTGKNKGEPNRPIRLNQNSACLLTARNPEMAEKDRYILGVYMVNETFIGKLCEDGYVPAHSVYRLRLSEQESEKMLFWNYYVNEKYPKNMTWNTGKYHYFNNVWMAQILRDIVYLKREPQERMDAQRFLEHFCQLNLIVEKDLPKPTGVLMRV